MKISITNISKLINLAYFITILFISTNCSNRHQNMQNQKMSLLDNYDSNNINITKDATIQNKKKKLRKKYKKNMKSISFLYNKKDNSNTDPFKFKVNINPINEASQFGLFDPRSRARKRKLCNMLIEAKNNTFYMNKEYQTMALVSFIRKSAPSEDKCSKFFRKVVVGRDIDLYKNTKLSINENYLSSSIIENTKLKLIKVYSFKQANINPNEYNNLKTIKAPDNISKMNAEGEIIFTENIASLSFMGNLNSIPTKSYILDNKIGSKEYIKNKINTNILSENMIFVSEDEVKM